MGIDKHDQNRMEKPDTHLPEHLSDRHDVTVICLMNSMGKINYIYGKQPIC